MFAEEEELVPEPEDHWMSISDLMSVLTMVFLFIAISFMENVTKIAEQFGEKEEMIHLELKEEFEEKLDAWSAVITKDDLSIRFTAPDVMFDPGKFKLKKKFKEILNEFCPKYTSIITKHRDSVEEVRIEGHTSSDWYGAETEEIAFLRNMELSQNRTRAVLEYCIGLLSDKKSLNLVRKKFTANGMSSSRPILTKEGFEDSLRSRRVVFRVRLNAGKQIDKIQESFRQMKPNK